MNGAATLGVTLEFHCDGVLVQYLSQWNSTNTVLENELIRGISEKGQELWQYRPEPNESGEAVWMGGAEPTLDKKLIHVWQSNCRRLKLDPHTGKILENIYQLT